MKTYLGINFKPSFIEKINQKQKVRVVTFNLKAKNIQNVTFIDPNNYRIKGSWYAYNKNSKIIEELRKKYPKLFIYKGIDIQSAVKKDVYWKNYREGLLEYIGEKVFSDSERVYEKILFSTKWFKSFQKYLSYFLKSFIKHITHKFSASQHTPIPSTSHFLFYINDDFEYKLIKALIFKTLFLNPIVYLPHNHKLSKKYVSELLESNVKVINGNYFFLRPILINPFKLSSQDFYMMNLILDGYNDILSVIENFLLMNNKRLKGIFLLAAENLPLGHALAEYGAKFGIPVFNAMNGIKAPTANNADVNFARWFVWDNQMKDMLVNECFLNQLQFYVSGHLAEDEIKTHKFLNSIQLPSGYDKSKIVISVFTPKDRRPNKINGLTVLYDLWKDKKDWIILYRPHPFEKEVDYFLPDSIPNERFIVINYNNENSKETLYDQLIISDLALVFGSTVAMEAKWAQLPCITYEESNKSNLYCVDGKNLKHINNPTDLANELNELKKKSNISPAQKNNVIDMYISGITEIIE